MKIRLTYILLLLICFSACREMPQQKNSIDYEPFYRNYIRALASDEFMGRKPFTKGEELTVNYLEKTFKEIGLESGNGNSFFQEVPMVDIAGQLTDNRVLIKKNQEEISLEYLTDIVAGTKRTVDNQKIENAELVFAGFGVEAPEYDWNDFDNVDVAGNIIMVMVNDPGFYNQDLFRGKNMTYYGRWTYKYEEAARRGAAGVLIIHHTEAASYGWDVVRASWSGSNLHLQSENGNADACAIEGWISDAAAKRIFDLAGMDMAKMIERAKNPGFKAVLLGLSLSGNIENKIQKKTSKNVIALLPGKERADEYIVYTAHWDHFGIGEPVDGDSIYNGAADNASGTAGLLTLAKKFKDEGPVDRSIVFLSVTGEEQGLLGSAYYTQNPVYPLSKTVANINMDVLQPFGRMKDILLIGKGQSDLDDYLEEAAQKQNRIVREPEDQSNGWYFRSDHFNFAKVGVPTLYIGNGVQSIEHGEEWGIRQIKDYNKNRYHKPQDNYDDTWDVSGTMEDLELIYQVGRKLGDSDVFPQWNEGIIYKRIREGGK